MTHKAAAPVSFTWPHSMHAGALAVLLCLYAIGTLAANTDVGVAPHPTASDTRHSTGMNLVPVLAQDSPGPTHDSSIGQVPVPLLAQGEPADLLSIPVETLREDEIASPLRLEHVLSSLGLVDPHTGNAGALARTPSWSSILKFLFWFALLLLASLTLRDTLQLFRHLLSRPPAPRPSMPYAPWPSMTVIFESHSASRIVSNLVALANADYPAERLKILVLCPLQESDVFDALQEARTAMPGRVVAMQNGHDGDVAGRCFSTGIRFGNGELVLVLSDTEPCLPSAIKACAERFFDPSLGALLGFLPGAAAGDKALAPRMANLLRIASQTAGMTSAAGMTPGTGLLALRRSAVRTVGMDVTRAMDCFALLRQLERFGSHHAVREGVIAAGEAVHNWDGRSRWIEACARAFAATMPLNPLHWLARHHAMPPNFGMQRKLVLPTLWSIVALGSVALYFTGNALAAAMGLTVCTATAYGVDGMPSAFNCTAVLFRVHGRRAEASLVAWAPVMFCHDLLVAVRSALLALRDRAVKRSTRHDVPTPTQPIEQSTLA